MGRPLVADALVAELGRDFYSRRLAQEEASLSAIHRRDAARLSRELLVQRFRREASLLASAHRREAARLGARLR